MLDFYNLIVCVVGVVGVLLLLPVILRFGKTSMADRTPEEPYEPPPPTGYRTVDDLVACIPGTNGDGCRQMLDDNRRLFETVQGSTNNHQAWPGGYIDHVTEVVNIAALLYRALSASRRLPFTLEDALLVVFLHDIEKPWKYEIGEDGQLHHREGLETKAEAHAFRDAKLAEYSIVLTDDQKNAMRYVEGEFDDYTNLRRVMGPLAAFCHLCDVTSARVWFDHPKESDDSWRDAFRIRQAR